MKMPLRLMAAMLVTLASCTMTPEIQETREAPSQEEARQKIAARVSKILPGQPFHDYLVAVAQVARESGISEGTITRALAGLEPEPRVIKFDRSQPEFVQTFEQYLAARVSPFRIREGRRLLQMHADILARVEDKYGVDAEYIVAFWGLETNFGRYQGKYPIIRSLATLGHDNRRSAFFTRELIHALQILDEGHVTLDKFVGAWAGAMGQAQFMPSSFLTYAEDFDGDGKIDLWHREGDVFASIANYLQKNGWQANAGWGVAVTLPAGLDIDTLQPKRHAKGCRALRHHTRPMPLADWQELGLTLTGPVPPEGDYSLVVPDKGVQGSYLAGGNFNTILSYNCANKYAVSVGLLADEIVKPGNPS